MAKKRLKHAHLFISIPIALLVMSACGLPTVSYLYPPSLNVGSASIQIQNNILNNDPLEGDNQTFKGVEIYYRIYQDVTTASSLLATLGQLRDNYDNYPDTFISIATETHKFRRLIDSEYPDRQSPLLPIGANDGSMYYLSLSGNSDWTLSKESTQLFMVMRNISTASDKSFYNRDFNAYDEDYDGTTTTNPSVYIVFFAISYGTDQTTIGQPIYSMPWVPANYVTY